MTDVGTYDPKTMQQIFVSNHGNDSNDGRSRENPIKSWKRLMQLSRGGPEWVHVEGPATRARLEKEAANLR